MSRPRRTRLYNTAYNIGESYYKPALDRLDRKYSGRPMFDEPPAPKIKFSDSLFDEDLSAARKRAEKAITEETFFDSKGLRASRGAPLTVDNDIDEEIQSTLSRIRANKQKVTSFADDTDFDVAKSSILRKSRIDFGEKDKSDDNVVGLTRRMLKVTTRTEDVEPSSLTKWSKFSDVAETNSSASIRAKATKSRLAEIDSDIMERSEKQAARERRLGNIKKLLAESEAEL